MNLFKTGSEMTNGCSGHDDETIFKLGTNEDSLQAQVEDNKHKGGGELISDSAAQSLEHRRLIGILPARPQGRINNTKTRERQVITKPKRNRQSYPGTVSDSITPPRPPASSRRLARSSGRVAPFLSEHCP